MEGYTVPKEVLAELRPKDTTRNVYAADHIRECTNLCRQLGLVAGIRDFNRKHSDMQVGASSAKRWLDYWKQKHTYYSPMKRGGDFHLSPEIEAEVLSAFTKIPICLLLASELNLFHKTYFIKLLHKLQP